MDLKDIDQWSRALLQNEARKRGIRTPEMYSRPELIKLILRHDYGSTINVREAARLLGGVLGSAKSVLRAGLGIAEERPARQPEPAVRRPVPEAPRRAAEVRVEPAPFAVSPWDEAPEPVPAPEPERTPSPVQPVAAAPDDEYEELSYGPHRDAGLLVRWHVGSEAIHRARAVLGAHGELALRVVTVRVEDGLFVRTETLDHGPIESAGDWTAPIEPSAARYVSSVGLRSGDRFVSIVHAAS
ncbi:MAG TPA: hypothetical protein VJV78_01580 [Polyangiales bacterium]|nr:hypothetical protein [Polyangiales bacterium]